ncbi:MAG: hypothetical protein AAF773_00040 [Cyanobacteria bacterium P01_D01_bin.115]
MEFSHGLALRLVQSQEEFPVDFDDAWRWLGYSTKQKAKNRLSSNFDIGLDYRVFNQVGKNPTGKRFQGGRPTEKIRLTIDCFKSLGMMAGTDKGKEIRRYFLECERTVKDVIPAQQSELEKLKLELALSHSRERLAGATHILALMNPGLPALAFGKPEAVIEIDRPVTIVTDAYGRAQRFDGATITELAQRYGFGRGKKANDRCRSWIRSLGIGDNQWIEEPAAHITRKLPREILSRLDQNFHAKSGERQLNAGE